MEKCKELQSPLSKIYKTFTNKLLSSKKSEIFEVHPCDRFGRNIPSKKEFLFFKKNRKKNNPIKLIVSSLPPRRLIIILINKTIPF